jgi:transcriptional regulator with XRE-family HTH domain
MEKKRSKSPRNRRIEEALQRGEQEKIAKVLGITRQTVNQKLTSDIEIDSIEFIRAVSQVTGKTFEYLVDGIDESKKKEDDHIPSQTVEMIEKTVTAQQRTIELLDKRMKRLEDLVNK